ncbi:MAG: hypothetical protein HC850_18150 [Rhodomicrobium sp.]|nr:hypothetical protein [Rhodomicrobium sp.]
MRERSRKAGRASLRIAGAMAALIVAAAMNASALACSGRIVSSPSAFADYNPFDAIDNVRDRSVTVENTGNETCIFALSFARIDTASSGGFAFEIQSPDGAVLSASAPGAASTGQLPGLPLAANESREFGYRVMIPAGQMLAPAQYDQPFELTLRGAARSFCIETIVSASFSISTGSALSRAARHRACARPGRPKR